MTPAWNFSKMRGTPAMKVGRTASRSSRMSAVPRESVVANPTSNPAHTVWRARMCASGRNRYCVSAAPRCMARTALQMEEVRFSCVSTTPLGVPVVPEV